MRLRLLAATAAILTVGIAQPLSAEAVPVVRFTKVYFDSPGSDTGSNASLNAEWVRVKNFASTARTISGWKIRDNTGFVYQFPTFTLKAGASVTLHTGKGTQTATDRYWGRTGYVWNNTGDKATLMTPAGAIVDTCAFSGAGDYVTC